MDSQCVTFLNEFDAAVICIIIVWLYKYSGSQHETGLRLWEIQLDHNVFLRGLVGLLLTLLSF